MLNFTEYDGRFDLRFLTDDERVCSTRDGTGAIEIISPTRRIRVEIGQRLHRAPFNGVWRITVTGQPTAALAKADAVVK